MLCTLRAQPGRGSRVCRRASKTMNARSVRKTRDPSKKATKKTSKTRKRLRSKKQKASLAGLCDVFSTKCGLKEEAKTHRVASLNAMAKVHILYENEGRPMPSEDVERTKAEKPKPGKRKREMVDSDVEIIDTRQCRRMASLNAQAIMAASYSQERSRKYEKESSCELKVVHHHQEEIVVVQTVHRKKSDSDSEGRDRHRPASSASSSQSVAVSEYRVHINTTKEVKDEQEKEAAAVTYRYRTKATCLQMQTTYNGDPILGPQSYYTNYPTPPAALLPPATTTGYTVDRVVSVAPMHYGSAFTVPRYPALPYAPVEYVPNYFQPAGPLIQTAGHEQCLIHKPVPFHPQQHLGAQPPQYPCFTECLGPNSGNFSACPYTSSPTPDFQIKMTAAPAVPKSEPVTPPETKSPPQGNDFLDASKALETEGSCSPPESALMAAKKRVTRAKENRTSDKKRVAQKESEESGDVQGEEVPRVVLSRKRRKFAHGWSWDGEPFSKIVVVNNEDTPHERACFPAMRHVEGDIIRVRDCVLLRSGTRKVDLPFVAKVAALWENDDDGEMMMSLLWYYRPEHTDQGRKPHHMEDEIFASKHRDCNSVACIEDKCYVLTFAEYCRYRARTKLLEEGQRPRTAVVPDLEEGYSRRDRLPPGRMDPQLVFFCRRVYDFRQRRILKNPSFASSK
ncbi:bromo adjacent homology domain-containing 1 protein-like [Ornithodoros turicata]|uniref:bromo adjacent homology domain-containing 1 protein-like n=1 Tax=Ornithodoros turicata TaxID=34597 RepID=UPI00313A25AA